MKQLNIVCKAVLYILLISQVFKTYGQADCPIDNLLADLGDQKLSNAIKETPELVNSWKSLDELGSSLKTDPAALTKLLDDFSVNPSLEAFLKNNPSKRDVWEMLHKTPYSSDINALEYVDEIRNTTKVGSANTTDYLKTWRDKFPDLQGGEPGKYFNVHHAIERQAIESRWPGLFSEAEIHSLENLRGISGELNSSLHLSEIRNRWDDFYDLYPPGGAVPTRQQVLDYAKQIDDEFGKFFSPPIRPLDY